VSGKIIADIIEAPAGRISLNVANVTVASINASGLYTSTGNLLITQANQIGTAAIVDGAVTDAKLTLAANASNIKTALNASGDAPIYACRAWVNFNGTGTPAIRAAGNVSSITDAGTGLYTVNFTTAMPDINYSAVASTRRNNGSVGENNANVGVNFRGASGYSTAFTTAAVQLCVTLVTNEAAFDADYIAVQIFR
jgi:hypothetical protein